MLIRNHNLTKPEAESCFATLSKNINELGIFENLKGKTYLLLNKMNTQHQQLTDAIAIVDEQDGLAEPEREDVEEGKSPLVHLQLFLGFSFHTVRTRKLLSK